MAKKTVKAKKKAPAKAAPPLAKAKGKAIKTNPQQLESIASVCHEAQRQHSVLAGGTDHPWRDTTQEEKESLMKRVKAQITKGKDKDKLFAAIVNALK